MRVLLLADPLVRKINTGGIDASFKNQTKALNPGGVSWTTDPLDPFDILHVHLNPLSPFTLLQMLTLRSKATRTIVQCHSTTTDFAGTLVYARPLLKVLPSCIRRVCRLADLVLCPSASAAAELVGDGVDRPIRPVSNGVGVDALASSTARAGPFRERSGITEKIMLSVGFVFPRKGIFDFVALAERFPDLAFVCCGKKFPAWLSARPLAVGRLCRSLPPNVRFLGFVPDIAAAHAAADIFFFPSYAENQGMALLEAVAAGKPIVARTLPAYREWLESGRNCLLADDLDGFARGIGALHDEAGLREGLGRRARECAGEHALPAVGRMLRETYEDLLGR
jgi:1,2-diacylglycerol-3-alpha-glucose alpha-1,2-glucosyltransferase